MMDSVSYVSGQTKLGFAVRRWCVGLGLQYTLPSHVLEKYFDCFRDHIDDPEQAQ